MSRPQQSTPRRRHRRRRRCRLENGCTYVAGRARKGWLERRAERIFLWRLEGNSPCPEENSSSFLAAFHIPYFFHRFFSPPPFRCVKPLRALYPMSTRFSFLFSFLSSSSPPDFLRLFGRISLRFRFEEQYRRNLRRIVKVRTFGGLIGNEDRGGRCG